MEIIKMEQNKKILTISLSLNVITLVSAYMLHRNHKEKFEQLNSWNEELIADNNFLDAELFGLKEEKPTNEDQLSLFHSTKYNDIPNYDEVENYEEVVSLPKEPELTIQKTNVFNTEQEIALDFIEEDEKRILSLPYNIIEEEYFNSDTGYSQTTLTYYELDDILVDETETPIYNYKSVVGSLSFGKGSSDRNTFYVRNDRLTGEYEVILDSGSYQMEVLGTEWEKTITQLNKLKPEKFRPE
jgi:hypothetical protein